ncbi:streptomycin biosynthesis regulator [Actinomadura sp. ATCC 31491]|uniref:Streptomycin biosynthesis regulator n=1 Tax=Actinomadura luzonensis TaxID=2805427 RepID=A0ABT0FJD1_9ACTN|nr:streptomycin biosynthesis regulator [Actinomadura luzonensis]MCK2212407.1 streptomycin biosynthesis regulator [Actinomadura luzonensis]
MQDPAQCSEPAEGFVRDGAVFDVPVGTLILADSPRLTGIDEEHVLRLAERLVELPPILVHRQTMRVVDGMHRLCAAVRAGRETVAACFFEGSEEEAFVQAVELNVRHGLCLSLADRKAAAGRILAAFPELSDRAIAAKTGLSDKTVALIRSRCADVNSEAQDGRVGRDGHHYPTDSSERRERVAQLISERPDASLRVIAAAAGVSPGTVSKVRKHLAAESSRRPAGRSDEDLLKPSARRRGADSPDPLELVEKLRRDPSLRDREAGRRFLRWLSRYVVDAAEAPDISAIPPHCLMAVAQVAQQMAGTWLALARGVEVMAGDGEKSLRAG